MPKLKKIPRRKSKKGYYSSNNTFLVKIFKLIKFVLAIFLIPVIIILLQTLGDIIKIIREDDILFSHIYVKVFFGGFFLWMIVFLFFSRPIIIYTLGHELTHYFFIKLFGGKVNKIKITSKGGYVNTNKTNDIIRLAPYFFPFYSIVLTLIYLFVYKFYNVIMTPRVNIIFFFILGVSYSFHLTFTSWVSRKDQSDIKNSGFIFSITQIILINLLSISCVLVFFSQKIDFRDFYDFFIIRWIYFFYFFN